MGMDVDAEDGSQSARVVNDYGVVVNFDKLKDDDRQVNPALFLILLPLFDLTWPVGRF